ALAARRAGRLPAVRAHVRDRLRPAAQDHRHRPARAHPMIRRVLPVLLVTLLALTARSVAAQQSASDLLAQGMRAYQSLDYDQAAAILRRGLARTTGDTLSAVERLQAFTYLGATELFRDNRDSALAAFRQIAVTDPKYRPSEIIFPPQVTGVFQEVRQQTKTVFLQVPAVARPTGRHRTAAARACGSGGALAGRRPGGGRRRGGAPLDRRAGRRRLQRPIRGGGRHRRGRDRELFRAAIRARRRCRRGSEHRGARCLPASSRAGAEAERAGQGRGPADRPGRSDHGRGTGGAMKTLVL